MTTMPAPTASKISPRANRPPRRVRHTKVPTLVFRQPAEASQHVALVIASLMRENDSAGMPTVLGLPFGSTPSGVYRELVRMHREEGLDFSNVIAFGLTEYWPMSPTSIHSGDRFLREALFDHVNIQPENLHCPPGSAGREHVDAACEEYERTIERAGGIDVLLLGLGGNGHIGFNEPSSDRGSRTRLVPLDPPTRHAAAGDFYGEENVPFHAVTVGVGTILSARKIFVLALGEHKARIVRRTVEDGLTEEVPSSLLQTHRNATIAIDGSAAQTLTAIATPWLVSQMEWTDAEEKRAVIWLAQRVEKPLLKLETRDFMRNQLHSLLRDRGPIDDIRQRTFNAMLGGICTKPGGNNPLKAIVFSPHPDDDVISMGGTLITLADQGHEVHIAYMTSGNIAVFDHDALRHIDYVQQHEEMFGISTDETRAKYKQLRDSIARRKPGERDTPDVLHVKGLIRQTEAVAGAEASGVNRENLHFLDLPFYRTGEITKNPIGDEDIEIVADLLKRINPDQIYMAGDLADPHGTHRVCAEAILHALPHAAAAGVQPEVWLYRGAWQEYPPHEIERAVPLSPEVMHRKKLAIFKHESQKDAALYPGTDEREFWVRAEQRTKTTAETYNNLGLPEFYAIEGFVQLSGQL